MHPLIRRPAAAKESVHLKKNKDIPFINPFYIISMQLP